MARLTRPDHSAPANIERSPEAAPVEVPPATLTTPHPKVAGLDRVIAGLAGPATASASAEDLGIVAYVSDVLRRDFLQYSPPEAKAFTLEAIRDARLGRAAHAGQSVQQGGVEARVRAGRRTPELRRSAAGRARDRVAARALAENLATALAEMMKHEGHPVDRSEILALVSERLRALDVSKELGPDRIASLAESP